MKCRECEELLIRQIGNESSASEEQALHKHLATCSHCRQLADSYNATQKNFEALDKSASSQRDITTKAKVLERIGAQSKPVVRSHVWRYSLAAAAFVAIVGLSAILYMKQKKATPDRARSESRVARHESQAPPAADVEPVNVGASYHGRPSESSSVGADRSLPAIASATAGVRPNESQIVKQPTQEEEQSEQPVVDTRPLHLSGGAVAPARSGAPSAGTAPSSGGRVAAAAGIREATPKPTSEATPVGARDLPRHSSEGATAGAPFLEVFNNVINPVNGDSTRIVVSTEGRVKLTIYDEEGNVTFKLFEGNIQGEREFSWSGTSAKNNIVAAGIYLVVMETNGFSDKQKIIVKK